MNLQSYIKEIRKSGKRAFTTKELVEHFLISSNYARVALHRLQKSGDIISPVQGLYVIIPPEYQPYGSIPAEELVPIIMKYLNIEYYVGLLSAAAYHGATHQKPTKFQVITNKRIKHLLSFGKVEIDLIYKKSLLDLPIQNIIVSTGYLKIASPELVCIDLLNYPYRCGGINHIATVLSELAENLDAKKLIRLAKDTRSEHQLQRIGYIIEKIDVVDDEKKDSIIKELASFVSANLRHYQPLASEIEKNGYPKCRKWRIIENADVESDL